MTAFWQAWLPWIVGAIFIVTGMVIIGLALFRDRARGVRRCPKCWYNLSGVETLTCSECGHSARREKHLHRTRRHWRWLLAGVFIFAIGVGGGIYPLAAGIDWQKVKPMWLLLHEGQVDSARGLAAREEVLRRVQANELSRRQIDSLVANILELQADPEVYWGKFGEHEATLGDPLEALIQAGVVDRDTSAQYAKQSLAPAVRLTARRIVRSGGQWELELSGAGPARRARTWIGTLTQFHLIGQIVSIRAGDVELPTAGADDIISYVGSSTTVAAPRRIAANLPPGQYEAVVEIKFTIRNVSAREHARQVRAATSIDDFADDPDTLATFDRTFAMPLTVVPADQPAVELVQDERVSEFLRAWVEAAADEEGTISYPVVFRSNRAPGPPPSRNAPIDLALELVVRHDDSEYHLGDVLVRKGGVNLSRAEQMIMPHKPSDEPDLGAMHRVDLIFRSAPRIAENTIDVLKIWDGEVVIEDVKLRYHPSRR